jgi:hypothetical protein
MQKLFYLDRRMMEKFTSDANTKFDANIVHVRADLAAQHIRSSAQKQGRVYMPNSTVNQ